jgi:putative FmdB family regulatory protein
MLRLFDFECLDAACGHNFEELVKYEDSDAIRCPLCNSPTRRLIGAPTIDPRLGLDAASFPTMADKWARVRRQRAKIESKRDQR